MSAPNEIQLLSYPAVFSVSPNFSSAEKEIVPVPQLVPRRCLQFGDVKVNWWLLASKVPEQDLRNQQLFQEFSSSKKVSVLAESSLNRYTARLAQSVEHETLNLRVVGSSPTLGASFWLFLTRTQLILVRLHRCTQSLRRHGLVG